MMNFLRVFIIHREGDFLTVAVSRLPQDNLSFQVWCADFITLVLEISVHYRLNYTYNYINARASSGEIQLKMRLLGNNHPIRFVMPLSCDPMSSLEFRAHFREQFLFESFKF